MQMNEKVLTALEVLRDAAENDFEKHRIEVLIQDLTCPPPVEIVDETHQAFNGNVYHKSKNGHFGKSLSIHRAVYNYYFGEIPAGYEIHHKDLNPENNDILNLQMLTKAEHKTLHNNNIPERECICSYCGKNFHTRSPIQPRFCSISCQKAWHYKFGKAKCFVKICPVCGKEFSTSSKHTKCCSPQCGGKFRQKRIPRNCPICGNEFVPHRNTQICCSKKCSGKNRRSVKPRNCPVCGKTFTPIASRINYCSRSCARKSRDLNKTTL